MKNYYFTYGTGHTTDDGFSLDMFYTKIAAESYGKARQRMFAARGDSWAFQYSEEEFLPQIEQYGLKEAPLERVGL